MASQTWALSAPTTRTSSRLTWQHGDIPDTAVRSEFVPSGQTIYPTYIDLRGSSGFALFALYFSTQAADLGNAPGNDLLSSFESSGIIQLVVNGSVTLTFPTLSDYDTSEPYTGIITSGPHKQAIADFITAVNALATITSVDYTLDEGAASADITTVAQTVDAGTEVGLQATAKAPLGATVSTVAWTATGGTFADASQLNASWTAPYSTSQQTYTLTLTVTASNGVVVTDTVQITVRASTTPVISGSPTGAGTSTVTVTVRDSAGAEVTRSFDIVVS